MLTSGIAKRKPSRASELVLMVQYGVRSALLSLRVKFRNWACVVLAKNARIMLRIVGVREARLLNHLYCGRDYAINVLTFIYLGRRPL